MEMIETLKKLQELAVRGVEGERDNAARKLQQLMMKYKISPEDIFIELKIDCKFKYREKWQKDLLLQIYRMVTNTTDQFHYQRQRRAYKVILKCTRAEFQELSFLYAEYSDDYRNKIKDFWSAYVVSNRIWAEATASDGNNKKYTLEEQARLKRIAAMAMFIPKKEFKSKRLTA